MQESWTELSAIASNSVAFLARKNYGNILVLTWDPSVAQVTHS